MKFLPLPTFNPQNKMINHHQGHEVCVSQYMEMVDEDSKRLAPAYKVFIDGEFWQDKFADDEEAEKAARTAIDRDPDLFGRSAGGNKTLTKEQEAALVRFAEENGRFWKTELNACWMDGNYYGNPDACYLQQVRNQFGPSWLVRYRLPKPDLTPE